MDLRFVCQFCGKRYQREQAYLDHECKERQRSEEIKTPIGQLGFMFYCQWMREQRRLAPPVDTFVESKYYRTFITFAKFTKRVQLPRPEKFIWLMVQKQWPPVLWTADAVYVEYLEYLDYKVPPMEQVQYSVQTICDITEQMNVDTAVFFEYLSVNEVIDLVRVRRLSPWLLLASTKFKQLLQSPKMTVEQRIVLETLIRPDFWATRMRAAGDVIKSIKEITTALGI
jgi:hypothetical protein